MADRWRPRLVLAFLVAFALWPAVHHGLVRTWGLDPWRFGGWAMYTAPKLSVATGLVLTVQGQEIPVDPAMLGPAQRRQVGDFNKYRRALGALMTPDALGGTILGADPRLDAVTVVVREQRMDPQTARIVEVDTRYRYQREVGAAP